MSLSGLAASSTWDLSTMELSPRQRGALVGLSVVFLGVSAGATAGVLAFPPEFSGFLTLVLIPGSFAVGVGLLWSLYRGGLSPAPSGVALVEDGIRLEYRSGAVRTLRWVGPTWQVLAHDDYAAWNRRQPSVGEHRYSLDTGLGAPIVVGSALFGQLIEQARAHRLLVSRESGVSPGPMLRTLYRIDGGTTQPIAASGIPPEPILPPGLSNVPTPGTDLPPPAGARFTTAGYLAAFGATWTLFISAVWTAIVVGVSAAGQVSLAPDFVGYEVLNILVDLGCAIGMLVLVNTNAWQPQRHRTVGAFVAALGFLAIWSPPSGLLIGPVAAILGGLLLVAIRPKIQ
jgi:hypothetical protein